MAPRPTSYIMVHATGHISIGSRIYEKAGHPQWIRPEWNGQQVILWKSEAPEKRRMGIVQVRPAQPTFSAKPIIAEAGLVPGRYRPTLVSRTRIVFETMPYWTPDQPDLNHTATEDDDDPPESL